MSYFNAHLTASSRTALSALLLALPTLFASQQANAISSQTITYEVADHAYEGYYAQADTANAPFILMIHDWDGVTDYERQRADMLAEEGYNVFAADMFGKGIRPTELEDKKRLTGELYADRNKMRKLLQGALQTAQAKGNAVQDGVTMGYCFGGTVALELARSGFKQKAFVPFHGGLKTPTQQNYDNTQGEIIVYQGSADQVAPLSEFTDLATRLEAANVPHEMITYSGARHAFSDFTNLTNGRYDERADKRSWTHFLDYLDDLYESDD